MGLNQAFGVDFHLFFYFDNLLCTFIYIYLKCVKEVGRGPTATGRNCGSLISCNIYLCFPPELFFLQDLLIGSYWKSSPGIFVVWKAQAPEAFPIFHKTSSPLIRWCWVSRKRERMFLRDQVETHRRDYWGLGRDEGLGILSAHLWSHKGTGTWLPRRGPGKRPQQGRLHGACKEAGPRWWTRI